MSWMLLLVAGLLEVAWAVGLEFTDGFTRPVPSVLTIAAIAGSMWLLAVAAARSRSRRRTPCGSASARPARRSSASSSSEKPLSLAHALFLGLLVTSIVGLRPTAP